MAPQATMVKMSQHNSRLFFTNLNVAMTQLTAVKYDSGHLLHKTLNTNMNSFHYLYHSVTMEYELICGWSYFH